jgi:hypothetical protein
VPNPRETVTYTYPLNSPSTSLSYSTEEEPQDKENGETMLVDESLPMESDVFFYNEIDRNENSDQIVIDEEEELRLEVSDDEEWWMQFEVVAPEEENEGIPDNEAEDFEELIDWMDREMFLEVERDGESLNFGA